MTENAGISARILQDLRQQLGLSKAKMADRCHVDVRTYYRYETGDSSPTMEELVRICEDCGASALQVVLRQLYQGGHDGPGAAQDREKLASYVLAGASDLEAQQLSYVLTGAHGSDLDAQIQMFCALDHLPIDVRLMIAKMILNAWEIEAARGGLINQDQAMPDVELLRRAIICAHHAVVAGRKAYTTKNSPEG